MDYELIRSNRRTLALEIRQQRVIVRAPARLPQRDIDRFVAAHAGWVDQHLTRARQYALAHPEPDAAQRAQLTARARAELPRRVARLGALMGAMPTRITITDARTRLGSCSSKGAICFSWRLMLYPDEAIDYVVAHELAHLRHLNHGPEFYAELERVIPDHKRRRAMLR